MTDDYGQKINLALAAVRRMHSDTSKLLVDADGTIGKGKQPVFSNGTTGLSYSYKAEYWMAWFVFRFYAAPSEEDQGIIDGISVWFFDGQSRIEEPYLLVGQVQYSPAEGQTVKDYCNERDLVYAFAYWVSDRRANEVLAGVSPSGRQDIKWFKLIGVPLFSIHSMQDVEVLMDRVRAAEKPA